jgi:RND family efflux transporter MFP subunit
LQAENEAAIAFRIAGRVIERSAGVGDHVEPGQVLAKLDPQNELNALRSARAGVSAAQGQLVEAQNTFKRQETLLARGFTTRVLFDQAQQGLRTAQARVEDAKAQLHLAEDQVAFTELKATIAGTITARGAEAGEVVQAGQMVFTIARKVGWDAVFDAPAQLIRSTPANPKITIALTDDPSVTAAGRIRQVDPQADPVTRTFRVRVSVIDPPPAMRLGATVTGRMELDSASAITVPASALANIDNQPAVWIVDPASKTVSLRPVEVLRFDPGSVVISQGLDEGEIVVTAGVQALHPGQTIRLIGSPS